MMDMLFTGQPNRLDLDLWSGCSGNQVPFRTISGSGLAFDVESEAPVGSFSRLSAGVQLTT
jgi:hypothetical protein